MFQRNPLPPFAGLKMLVAGSSKTVPNYHDTLCHRPEHSNIHLEL